MIATPSGSQLWVVCTGVHPKLGRVPPEHVGDLVVGVARGRELTERYGGCAYVLTTVLEVHGKRCDEMEPAPPKKRARAKRRR